MTMKEQYISFFLTVPLILLFKRSMNGPINRGRTNLAHLKNVDDTLEQEPSHKLREFSQPQ